MALDNHFMSWSYRHGASRQQNAMICTGDAMRCGPRWHPCTFLESDVHMAVQEVRKAVVGALAPDIGTTLPAIINRTRDVEPEVRPMLPRAWCVHTAGLQPASRCQRCSLSAARTFSSHGFIPHAAARLGSPQVLASPDTLLCPLQVRRMTYRILIEKEGILDMLRYVQLHPY